jgi:hypothetical protein
MRGPFEVTCFTLTLPSNLERLLPLRKPSFLGRHLIIPLFVQLVDQSIFRITAITPGSPSSASTSTITRTPKPAIDATIPSSRRQTTRTRRCKNYEDVLFSTHKSANTISQTFSFQKQRSTSRRTYLQETPNPRPKRVIRQLSPPALLQHHATVHTATHDVDSERDDEYHAEDASRGQRLLGDFNSAARSRRAGFKEVGTLVWIGTNEVKS